MENSRNILPSSYSQQFQAPLVDTSELSRLKEPLSDSPGNAQLHTLASVGLYHENKRPPIAGHDRSMYSMPTLPSQPLQPSLQAPLGNTLALRKQNNRKRRFQRSSRNPIVDSPQYQAYRARQNRDGNTEEQAKWPDKLEMAFLDALIEIPYMGRRKFSYKNKPHGRNELIKEYLWLAYLSTLAPGEREDPAMRRTRKQVSSHIQVLKGFLRGHPAYERLFPPNNKSPKNGFEDSFKNDPTLIALTQGRLPNRRHDQFDDVNRIILSNHHPMKPSAFWLLMTPFAVPNERNGVIKTEQDLRREGLVLHRYCGLASSSRPRGTLESIPNWRPRFPYLAHLHSIGELNCDIIHMDVPLDLMKKAPDKSELLTRLEMAIPGRDFASCQWQSVTSLIKPAALYGDPSKDPMLDATAFPMYVLGITERETRIKVAIPAETWAYTFTQLMTLHFEMEKKRMTGAYAAEPRASVRDYVDQISMYQELQSSSGDRMPYIRRAILIWTFHQARAGESNDTSWRYVDAPPPRHLCMSPPPQQQHGSHSHNNLATMNDYSAPWDCDSPLHLQTHHNLLDPFVQGLATPPHTASLQSPFDTSQVYTYPAQSFDMSMSGSENLSFVSHAGTVDSDATLVEQHERQQLDNLFSAAAAANNANGFVEYDSGGVGQANWNMQPEEEFDAQAAGWANYHDGGGAWDGKNDAGQDVDAGEMAWPDTSAGVGGLMEKLNWAPVRAGQEEDEIKDVPARWGQEDEDEDTLNARLRNEMDRKVQVQVDPLVEGRDDLPWSDVVLGGSPGKQQQQQPQVGGSYIEGSIESKLVPWIEQASAEEAEAHAHAQRQHHSGNIEHGYVEVVGQGSGVVDVEALERAVEGTEGMGTDSEDNGGHIDGHGVDVDGQHVPEQQGWVRVEHGDMNRGAVVGAFGYEHLDESVTVKS